MTLCLGPSLEIFETNSRIGKLDWGMQLGEKFYTSEWMNPLLLAAIRKACPNLRVLILFHGTLQPRHQFDYLCKEIMKHYYGDAEPLDGSFKSLTALTVSHEIVTLLPHETSSSLDLLQLRVRMNPIKIVFLNVDEIVAYNLYPSLKHLVIHLEGNMIESFLPSSATGITSLGLWYVTGKKVVSESLFHQLIDCFPDLSHLSLHSLDNPFPMPVILPKYFQPLIELKSLKSLHISRVETGPGRDAAGAYSYIGGSLSHLEILELPHCYFELFQLHNLITRMPKLEHLQVLVKPGGMRGFYAGRPVKGLRIIKANFIDCILRENRRCHKTGGKDNGVMTTHDP
ncbi:hypothetical protein RhiJN_27103 [Ceratobasidium sp. AG-Ba]|nr:hypothetical protein RhiJN_27103 [Ceratobasidium sp. AG-Ba]